VILAGATKGAIEWLVRPHVISGWKSDPVIQVSQVGYHPRQQKIATIELDRKETELKPVTLFRLTEAAWRRSPRVRRRLGTIPAVSLPAV